MAALRAHPRRLEPGRAAAGDEHAPLRRRRLDLVGKFALVAGRRVVEAGRAQLAHAMGGADARAHPLLLAAHELRDKLRIRDVGTGHRDHVEQPLADRVPRGRELRDARGVEDRQIHRPPERTGPGEKRGHGRGHPRHAVHRELDLGVHAAVDGVEEVDGAGRLKDPGDLQAVLEVEAVLTGLVDHEPDADDEVVAHRLADRLVHHQPEPAAVLDRAAEPVGAAIGRGRQELPDEVRAGQGLDAVEPAVPAPRGGAGVVGDDPLDVVLVHLPCERPMQGLAHGGRPDGCEPRAGVGLAAAAHVGDLAHQVCTAGVDALGESPEVLDDTLVVQVDLREVPLGVGGDVRRAAEHRERDPAPGLRLVVPLVALRGHPALGEAARMAGAHDAVAEGEMLQRERLEQRVVRDSLRCGRVLGHVGGLRSGRAGRFATHDREGYGVRPVVV